jgi:hypothetical protein
MEETRPMPPTTKDPKAPLNSDYADWLKKLSPLLGVALNVIAPQVAAPTSSASAASEDNAAFVRTVDPPSDKKRLVNGGGGYVFEQHADGKIFIVESPKNGKKRIQVTDQKAYQAILKEIGPFPKTPSPAPSKSPPPAPNPKTGPGASIFDQMQGQMKDVFGTLGTALDNSTGHLFTQSADNPKAPAAEPLAAQRVVSKTQDSYRNQRDNPELGDTSCNVTSLAMQLLSLAGGDETKLRETAVALLKKRGVTASTGTQLEELLRQLAIKVAGGQTVPLADGKTSPAWQMAWVLDGVSELFTDYVTKTEHIAGVASKEKFEEKLAPALAKGAAIMLSTKLTSSGHIVKLNEILADGILLDDPFGCRVDQEAGYLRNGANLSQKDIDRINENAAALDSRLKSNAALRKTLTDLAAAKKGSLPGNAGKNNFFSWDEVKTYLIGKWANVTYKK